MNLWSGALPYYNQEIHKILIQQPTSSSPYQNINQFSLRKCFTLQSIPLPPRCHDLTPPPYLFCDHLQFFRSLSGGVSAHPTLGWGPAMSLLLSLKVDKGTSFFFLYFPIMSFLKPILFCAYELRFLNLFVLCLVLIFLFLLENVISRCTV